MNYNIDYDVKYDNNREYRYCLRKVFNMDVTKMQQQIDYIKTHNEEEYDSETEDEMLFDDNSVIDNLEYLFNSTVHIKEFKEIYESAAAKVISLDLNFGMVICFSYDYFYLFHPILVTFFKENKIDENKYNELKNLVK